MNTKVFQLFRIPSLLLAALLQFMPMVRAAVPFVQSASNLFAIVFRWGAAAAAALGTVQAVSGASTAITLGNVTATNGLAITNRLLTSPQTAGWWSASGTPPGIGLIGSGTSTKLGGTPTAVGVYSVVLTAKSSASAGASETTSKTIVYTVIANTGGGGSGASNSPPVANAQSVSTAEDTAKAITLTGSDPDGNTLTYTVVASPTFGTLTGTAPNVTYTPNANYNGADSFTFRVSDGTNNSATATVSITITAVNDAPVANAQSVSTAEDTAKTITLTGTDVDGNPLTYAIVASPTHGTLSGTAPNVTYTPATNYNGADSFTFKVNDGTVDSATATVSITVTAANDAPVATAQSVSTAEDTAKAITLTGTDVDGNPLTYTIVTSPAHGTLSGTAPNVTYTPATNYNGADSFTFKVNDGTVDSATATVSITVTAVNDPPVAIAQAVATDKNVAKSITLAGTDVDGNTLTYTVVTQPTKGTLSGTVPNLTYTPSNNVTGSDSFTFKVNDGTVDSATATVSITIAAGPNTPPVANAQSVSATEDTAKAIILTGTDADSNPLTYAIVTSPAHGTLTGTAPNVTYTPATNYNGADSFSFLVNDGSTNSAPATVSISVAAVNDAPIALAQSVATDRNVAKSITLTGSDVDGNPLTFAVVTQPAKGVLSGSAPNLTYTPNTNATGADSFTFKANDGTVDSAVATVSITIAPGTNTPPVAVAQNVTTSEDTAKAITLTGTDADGNTLTYTVVTPPTHGTLSGTAPNITYTPATNYHGSDTIWFKVNDGTVDSALAVISLTVTSVNDAPLAFAQTVSVTQDTVKAIVLTGSDADGDALTYTIVTPPAHGAVSGVAPNLNYTPATNYTGGDTIWFKVNDGTIDSALAVVTITVNAAAVSSNNLPVISVLAGLNAAEPHNVGSFLFTRSGNAARPLTFYFSLDGTAQPGVDYSNPGDHVTFGAGKTNATLQIKPIADKIFDGAKTVVLSIIDSTNYESGELDSASILIGDDDRPRISISALHPAPTESPSLAVSPASNVQALIHASAYAGLNLILQSSTDLTNWTVVAQPPVGQPIDYVYTAPEGPATSFYRVIYINGAITPDSIAEALTYQMFSANVVGVVNTTVQPGWNLAANPLNGLPEDGALGNFPNGLVFVPFKSNKPNTYEDGEWTRGIPLVRSTSGGWFRNPSNAPITVTYVGELPNPSSLPKLRAGWSIRSSAVNLTAGNETLLGYPLNVGDLIYELNSSGTDTNSWTTHQFSAEGWDVPPTLVAGKGVLMYKAKPTKPTAVAPLPPTPKAIKFISLGN